MHEAFQVHMLSEEGKAHAKGMAEAFDELLTKLTPMVGEGRYKSLLVTHLEQACFWAKKGMAQKHGTPL